MSPTSYQTAPPRVKLGTNYTTRDQHRSTETLKHKKARTRRACLFGTEEGTRTPTAYGHYHLKVACLPIPPPRQKPYCPSSTSGRSPAVSAGLRCSSTGTSSTAGLLTGTSSTAGSGRPAWDN